MYAQAVFRESDESVLLDAIDAIGAGTLVTEGAQELSATFLPLLVVHRTPGAIRLAAHVAKANPQWRTADVERPFLLTTTGPHGYISPGWYPTKQETGKVVPTWDYIHVQVRGRLQFLHDQDDKLAIVTALTDRHESTMPEPWAVTDAPGPFIDKMLAAIVGISLDVTSIEGSWKLSQNRPSGDRASVAQALTDRAPTLAEEVRAAPGI